MSVVAPDDLIQTDTDADAVDPTLVSCVATSPADALLRQAITTALSADASSRGELFSQLLSEIAAYMKERPEERPWTYEALTGTDGSRIFRGQTGRSIVVDPRGTLWKARTYEDFDVEYAITESTCTIKAITPKYELMRPYSLELATADQPPSS